MIVNQLSAEQSSEQYFAEKGEKMSDLEKEKGQDKARGPFVPGGCGKGGCKGGGMRGGNGGGNHGANTGRSNRGSRGK